MLKEGITGSEIREVVLQDDLHGLLDVPRRMTEEGRGGVAENRTGKGVAMNDGAVLDKGTMGWLQDVVRRGRPGCPTPPGETSEAIVRDVEHMGRDAAITFVQRGRLSMDGSRGQFDAWNDMLVRLVEMSQTIRGMMEAGKTVLDGARNEDGSLCRTTRQTALEDLDRAVARAEEVWLVPLNDGSTRDPVSCGAVCRPVPQSWHGFQHLAVVGESGDLVLLFPDPEDGRCHWVVLDVDMTRVLAHGNSAGVREAKATSVCFAGGIVPGSPAPDPLVAERVARDDGDRGESLAKKRRLSYDTGCGIACGDDG